MIYHKLPFRIVYKHKIATILTHTCMHVCTHSGTNTGTHMDSLKHTHAHAHTWIHSCTHGCTRMYGTACIYIHTNALACTYAHTHSLTHTNTSSVYLASRQVVSCRLLDCYGKTKLEKTAPWPDS